MEIIAHRGAWHAPAERNGMTALRRAWAAGHGVETDLRDLDGVVVVSHDPPRSHLAPPTLEQLLAAWAGAGRAGRLALNIKADGLAGAVADQLHAHGAEGRSFVFDMSVPDQRQHAAAGLAVFSRWSDVEPSSAAALTAVGAAGVWLDAFEDDAWWEPAEVGELLTGGVDVVLVSPELHGRDPGPTWERVRAAGLHERGLALCTDHVHRAEEFFA